MAVTETALLVEASYRTGRRLYRLPVSGESVGEPEILSFGEGFQSGYSATRDGDMVAFLRETDTAPPDVFVARTADSTATRLTDVNPQVRDFALGSARVVTWQSRADGEPIGTGREITAPTVGVSSRRL